MDDGRWLSRVSPVAREVVESHKAVQHKQVGAIRYVNPFLSVVEQCKATAGHSRAEHGTAKQGRLEHIHLMRLT